MSVKEREISGQAIASLCFALFSLCYSPLSVVGVVLALKALRNIKQGKSTGYGWAVAGLCLNLGILLVVVVWLAMLAVVFRGR